MFQFVLGANFAVDLSRSSQGMFEYEYFFRPDSSANSWRSTGAVRLMESPGAAKAAGDSIRRTEPVARKEAADESSTTQLKYSYTNMPWEDLETSTAKFAPKTNWNTLYPEKRLRLEKKSPVARKDLAPAGNFETYAKTYPGLYSALSGLPMGETTPFLGAKPAEPPADAPKK